MDSKQIVRDVREVFDSGRTREVGFRKQQLRGLQRMYAENLDALCLALDQDLRKPRQECILLELNVLRDDLVHTLSNLDQWVKPESVSRNMATMFDKPVIYKEPFGVVLVIGAWNYPVQLTLLPVAGAIAAGNCVVIKPSENAPATSQLIAKLLPQYIDQECYPVVEGGIPETTELLKERFDYIFYTGAPNVGKIIHRAAAEHLTPTTLELGGKSPLYIDDTVDLNIAVRRILWGKLINSGQTCIAPDYMLCTKQVQEQFLIKAKEVLLEFFGSDPKDSPDYARIVSHRHVDRLSELLKEGTVVIGGDVDRDQNYIAPTIITDLPEKSKIMSEEIFGPILPIVNVNSAYEAIKYIKEKSADALACYVYTTKSSTTDAFLNGVRCGGITINDNVIQLGIMGLPFGGIGNSGMGQYHGRSSFESFTHRKSCLHRNYNPIAEVIGRMRYAPYKANNVRYLTAMLKERWMPSLTYLPHVLCFGVGMAACYAATHIYKATEQEE